MPKASVEEVVELLKHEIREPRSDLAQTWAVFIANLRIFLSYKTWVATETIATSASIVMYYFVGFLVEPDKLA
ncbi:MAG: hypothetical protein HXS50_04130, partial [Theionarchaea archaeon]|nr:hypothetical protein [Theionarchaea archaeon]